MGAGGGEVGGGGGALRGGGGGGAGCHGGGPPPIGLPRLPSCAEALLVGVAVLRDNRANAFRMLQGQPQAYGRAIVEDIECIAGEPVRVDEAVDHLGEMVETIVKPRARRRDGVANAWQVRCE